MTGKRPTSEYEIPTAVQTWGSFLNLTVMAPSLVKLKVHIFLPCQTNVSMSWGQQTKLSSIKAHTLPKRTGLSPGMVIFF